MSLDNEIEEIKRFLNSQNSKVRAHCSIKVNDELGALHISKSSLIEEFYPKIGNRQAHHEDRTIPRVCVCSNLMGCIDGYASIYHEFKKYYPVREINDREFKNNFHYNKTGGFNGGWYIYKIDYDVALMPDKELVYDSYLTEEFWLVNYKREYRPYKFKIIGKFWVDESKREYKGSEGVKETYSCYMEINEPMRFDKDKILDSGRYRFNKVLILKGETMKDKQTYHEELMPIEKAEYLLKKGHVDNLSYTEKKINTNRLNEFITW